MNERSQWLDLFAAGLERDLSVAEAARKLGKSPAWGSAAMKEICAKFGSQAA